MNITPREQKALNHFGDIMQSSVRGSKDYDMAMHIRAFICSKIRARARLEASSEAKKEVQELVLNLI